MSGRDLIGTAQTGSGKTLAFVLPMFAHILDQPVETLNPKLRLKIPNKNPTGFCNQN